MTGYIVITKAYRDRAQVTPQFCTGLDEAVGCAVLALDRAMNNSGFKGKYQLLCPVMDDGVVNVTAVSETRDGYPKQLMVDAYIAPVNLGTAFDDDFTEVKP